MDNVLMASEIEFYIDTMKRCTLENIGSNPWLEWHQRLQKLNQQALIEAASMQEERVKETLVSFQKTSVLVHEAILINIWKYKVLPLMLNLQPKPESTFLAYTILYHEAVCVALLELIMFHANCAEALDDSAVDLLDYVCGTISQLLSVQQQDGEIQESSEKEILRQRDNLSFEIGVRSLTIIRYLAEYVDKLPLGVCNRTYCFHDVPTLLTEILIEKPWLRDGKLYTGGRWVVREDDAVGQPEAQVWLALHQLLLHPYCAANYELTATRRGQFAKLQNVLQPVLLDQLSILVDLKQWLCKASFSDPREVVQKPVLLVSTLEIKKKILQEGEGRWNVIAKSQLPTVFCSDQKILMETAQKLCDAYNTDLIEKLEVTEKHSCDQCGKSSIQRCSRCKKGWYCSRKCQVTHWPMHQELCNERVQN